MQPQIVKTYVRRYRLAIALMFAAVTFAFGISVYATSLAAGSEAVVNLAGRQRMLIQRSLWECALVAHWGTPANGGALAALSALSEIQAKLGGDEVPAHFSPANDAYVRERLLGPDGAVEAGRNLVARARTCADFAGYDAYVRATEPALRAIESLMAAYEEIARATIRRIQFVEASVWLASLGILVFEVMFIFLPLRRELTDAVHSLQEANETMTATLDAANEGVFVSDASGTILSANRAVERITGYPRAELIGGTPRLFSSGRHPKEFYAAMFGELAARGVWRGTIWNRRKSGEIFPEALSVAAVHDSGGRTKRYVAVLRDISLELEAEEKLKRSAFYDPLTGLANRALFRDRLEFAHADAERSGVRFALAYLDLDGFKPVNDRFGHLAGDELLQQVARRLGGCLRKSDTLARLGGDEFAIVLHKIEGPGSVEIVGRRIDAALAEPFALGEGTVRIGVSVGWSIGPRARSDVASMIAEADAAMYEVKRARKRRHFEGGERE